MDNIHFISSEVLNALYFLPPLWLLLRLAPIKAASKRNREEVPILSFGIKALEGEKPLSPAWQSLLRIFIAFFIIVGISEPVKISKKAVSIERSSPLILIIDNGITSARDWDIRLKTARNVIQNAQIFRQPVLLLPTTGKIETDGFVPALTALKTVNKIKLLEEKTDRKKALSIFRQIKNENTFSNGGMSVWISDGIKDRYTDDFITELRSIGELTILTSRPFENEENLTSFTWVEGKNIKKAIKNLGKRKKYSAASFAPARLFKKAVWKGQNLELHAIRAADKNTPSERTWFKVYNKKDIPVDYSYIDFSSSKSSAVKSLFFPPELAKTVSYIGLGNSKKTGNVFYPENKFHRTAVGIISNKNASYKHPLLEEQHYIEQALPPEIDVYKGKPKELLKTSVIFNTSPLKKEDADILNPWVKKGGTLVQFANTALSENSYLLPDNVFKKPVAFGGNLSPSSQRTVSFEKEFSFIGENKKINIEKILISKTENEIWAKLDDNIPLVSAKKHGKGNLVFIHVPALPVWSDFPLTEEFVLTIKKLVNMNIAEEKTTTKLPEKLVPLKIPSGISHKLFEAVPKTKEYKPALFTIAFVLLVLDIFLSFMFFRKAFAFASLSLLFAVSLSSPAIAFDKSIIYDAISNNKTAVIKTDKSHKKQINGMQALSDAVQEKTGSVFSSPAVIDISIEPVLFFPMIYWKIDANTKTNSIIKNKVQKYLETGGAIIFAAKTDEDAVIEKLSKLLECSQWNDVNLQTENESKISVKKLMHPDRIYSAFMVDENFIEQLSKKDSPSQKFAIDLLISAITGDEP